MLLSIDGSTTIGYVWGQMRYWVKGEMARMKLCRERVSESGWLLYKREENKNLLGWDDDDDGGENDWRCTVAARPNDELPPYTTVLCEVGESMIRIWRYEMGC